jgi:competence protein ComEC
MAIFVATFLPLTLIEIATITFFGLISILLWRKNYKNIAAEIFLFIGIILVSFSLGVLRVNVADYTFSKESILDEKVGEKMTLQGQVIEPPDKREKSIFLNIRTETDLVLVSIDKYQDVSYGDIVEVTGVIKVPENFVTDLGRVFNYEGYLKAKGIKYQINFGELNILETKRGNKFITELYEFKQIFLEKLEVLIPEPEVALGEGLLLGVKQALGDELETAFRKTGIIHVVVLSGYNIMLVVSFVMYLFSHFFTTKVRTVIGILSISIFAILVGLSATVIRASIMASLWLFVKSSGRIYVALRGLIVAATVMVIINPYLLAYDASFQLSFLATLGLILISPDLEKFFQNIIPFTKIREIFVATLATQITVLPLLLYLIGEFSIVALVVNVIVLPVVPISMLLTFLTGLLSFGSLTLAGLLSVPTYYSLLYINEIAIWFAKLPFSAYTIPSFPFYLVVVTYSILFILMFILKHKKQKFIEINKDDLANEIDGWLIEEELENFSLKQK